MSILHSIAVRVLPLTLDAQECGTADSRTILTFGMQRSGQHLVIGWICRNLGECIHFNHCRYVRDGLRVRLTPLTGRRSVYEKGELRDDSGAQGRTLFPGSLSGLKTPNLLYSMEDMVPQRPLLRKMNIGPQVPIVVILRDPYNWLASALAHGLSSKVELLDKIVTYKTQIRLALGRAELEGYEVFAINYDRFVVDSVYRQVLAADLRLEFSDSAESSLRKIPDFGGGSSFSKAGFDEAHRSSVFRRWTGFVEDPFYRSAVADLELVELADAFFGDIPFRSEIASALAPGEV